MKPQERVRIYMRAEHLVTWWWDKGIREGKPTRNHERRRDRDGGVCWRIYKQ
jgi:hypothetical protein